MKIRPVLLTLLLPIPGAHAFPPSPHYTPHGMVRDQVEPTLAAEMNDSRSYLVKHRREIP